MIWGKGSREKCHRCCCASGLGGNGVSIRSCSRQLRTVLSISSWTVGDLAACAQSVLRTGLNIELNYPQNLERLVLGCIDSYDSESRRIFSDFSRSTRFACLCTAPDSKFPLFFIKSLKIFSSKFRNFDNVEV